MKVLLVEPGPWFSVQDVYNGLEKGLRANGATVGRYNLSDRLNFFSGAHIKKGRRWVPAFSEEAAVTMAAEGIETICYEWWPDVVIVVMGAFIPPRTWAVLARRPHHVVLWATESPYEDDRQSRTARYADTVILNDPTNLEQFKAEITDRTYYFPHSYDPEVHYPGPSEPDLACDFAFVGTGFPSRVEFFESVNWSGIDARFAGNWMTVGPGSPLAPMLANAQGECIDNVDAARLYRSAAVGANVYRKEHSDGAHAAGWAMGPREVELAACGSFFMREPRPEGDELFPMLPTFTTPAEFESKLRWWLARPELREDAASAARAAIADRTFTNTAARLLSLVDGVGKCVAA